MARRTQLLSMKKITFFYFVEASCYLCICFRQLSKIMHRVHYDFFPLKHEFGFLVWPQSQIGYLIKSRPLDFTIAKFQYVILKKHFEVWTIDCEIQRPILN